MNHQSRVVISGIGVVAPVGVGKKAFWSGLLSGKSGTKRISTFDVSGYPTQVAGEIRDFDPMDFMPLKEIRRLDRSSQMILAAGKMAVDDARIDLSTDSSRTGVFTGTAVGGQSWAFREYQIFREKGIDRINPFTAIATFPNASSAQISSKFGLKGPSDTISSGCVSSTVALGYALDYLRQGRIDIALVGGTEAPLDAGIFGAYCAARVMTRQNENPCKVPRPFDASRDGIVLSEGAAVLVCENLDRAIRRNARVYAEISGWSHNADSFSLMMMNPDGAQARRVMCGAIADAGISAEEIEFVQAHAAGTISDDETEARALMSVFGPRTNLVPVVSVKSAIGHAQGACGSIEAAAIVLSLYKGQFIRSINCDSPDPKCAVNINRTEVLDKRINYVLMNTFGFGGKNASIVFRAVP